MIPRWLLLTVSLAVSFGSSVRGADAPKPRVDRYGDPLPAGALMRLGTTRLRPESPATAVLYAPDGKTLYSVGNDPSVHVWDPATGKLVRRVPLPATVPVGRVCLAVSGDGKSFYIGGQDGSVHVHDAVSGESQRVLAGGAPHFVSGLSLAADGKTLVTMHAGGQVTVWDVASGKARHQLTGTANNVSLVALLPDGKQFVMAKADHSLHVVDAVTGKDVRAFDMKAAVGTANLQQRVQRLTLSPDGKLLAFGGYDRIVTLASVETGKVVSHIDNQYGANASLAFAPNGRFLAMGTYPGVRIFGVASGKELRQFDTLPASHTACVSFAPDGKGLASVGQDGGIRLWDVPGGKELHPPVGHSAHVQALTFLADGKHLVSTTANDGRLLLWEAASGREVEQYRGQPFNAPGMTATPDGTGVQWMASDRSLHVWRPKTGLEVRRLDLPQNASYQSAMSSDGKRVAAMGNDRKLRVYDLTGKDRDGRVLEVPGQVWFNLMVFSADGRRLATTSNDGGVRVWDAEAARPVRTLGSSDEGPQPGYASRLAFSPDGRSLLLFDNELRIWEVASGRERVQLPNVPVGLTAAAWSANGQWVARGNQDGTVHVFAAGTGQEVAKWEGKQGMIQSLAFSRDGRLLASGGANGSILIWEMPGGGDAPAALTDKEREALWGDLIDADAGKAYRAVLSLAGQPWKDFAFFKDHIKPRPAPPDAARLQKLIGKLDSDEFAERETASKELAEAGPAAEDVLRKALDKEVSAEVRQRVEELLGRISKNGVAPERLRSLRAVEVLERIGTPQAKQLLADLAKQVNDPMVEQDIKASLDRLGERR